MKYNHNIATLSKMMNIPHNMYVNTRPNQNFINKTHFINKNINKNNKVCRHRYNYQNRPKIR